MTSDNGNKLPGDTRRSTITALLRTIETNITGKDGKATIADYVRLIQLERELEEEEKVQPRNLKVTWIEPSEMYDFEE